MQLQKLVFLAHGFSLGLTGRPLFEDDVQAWQWGPVIPRLYNKLKIYGDDFVTEEIPENEERLDEVQKDIIDSVWREYGRFSGAQLSGITHQDGSPWYQTWAKNPFKPIPQELITGYFQGNGAPTS